MIRGRWAAQPTIARGARSCLRARWTRFPCVSLTTWGDAALRAANERREASFVLKLKLVLSDSIVSSGPAGNESTGFERVAFAQWQDDFVSGALPVEDESAVVQLAAGRLVVLGLNGVGSRFPGLCGGIARGPHHQAHPVDVVADQERSGVGSGSARSARQNRPTQRTRPARDYD